STSSRPAWIASPPSGPRRESTGSAARNGPPRPGGPGAGTPRGPCRTCSAGRGCLGFFRTGPGRAPPSWRWRPGVAPPGGAARPIRELALGEGTAPAGTEAVDVIAPSAGPASVVLIGRGLDPASVEIPESWGDADVAVRTARGLVPLRGDGTVRERVGERLF